MARLLPIALLLGTLVLSACDPRSDSAVTGVWPATPVVGGEIRVAGRGFGRVPGTLSVGGAEFPQGSVTQWDDGTIRATVPPGTPTGQLEVTTNDGRTISGRNVAVVSALGIDPLGAAEGSQVYRVVARAFDAAGKPVSGVLVSFLADRGEMSEYEALTDEGGAATTELDLTGEAFRAKVEAHVHGRLMTVAVYDTPGVYDLGREVILSGAGVTFPVYVELGAQESGDVARVSTLNRAPTGAPGPTAGSLRIPAVARGATTTGEVLVVYSAGPAAASLSRAGALTSAGVQPVRTVAGVDVALVPPGLSLDEALARLNADPRVAYAEPVYRVFPAGLPNDPELYRQWGTFAVGAPFAWSAGTGTETGVTVAVVDSAIDTLHPDLAANVLPGYDFCADATDACLEHDADPHSATAAAEHGTHVAGIIAAAVGNNLGTAGVAPGALLLPVKVFAEGVDETTQVTVAVAIRWAAGVSQDGVPDNQYPADVINLSLGGNFESELLQEAIDDARSSGAVVVAAAGNEGSHSVNFPAAAEGVIGVGAVDEDLGLAWYSNYGVGAWGPGGVDLVAPGTDVFSTLPQGSSGSLSGTSMATPHVSAAAALVLALEPDLTPDEVQARLAANAYFDAGWMTADKYGAGLLRADGAVGLPAPTAPSDRLGRLGVTTPAGTALVDLDLVLGTTGWAQAGQVAPGEELELVLEVDGQDYGGSITAW